MIMFQSWADHKMFQSWAGNIIKSKFEDPIPSEDLKDHFMRGEWEVFSSFCLHPETFLINMIMTIITMLIIITMIIIGIVIIKIIIILIMFIFMFTIIFGYQVIMELIEKHPEFKAGKVELPR